ncbi:flavin reductase family protein [Magnetovibrio sp.]|uniref:flavin reductase family protein n=1 Tax=Magnetovibrio sp. TaxID=2024836 RepID=UPI002F92F2DD
MANEKEQLQSAMKEAMRRLAGSVCVVSTRSGETKHAMSATAVTSLSMDPPSLLVCVNRAVPFHDAMSSADQFCINILNAEQSELSAACGGKLQGDERFKVGHWGASADGVPYLEDGLASLLCDKDGQFDYGTHTIFIGKVNEIRVAETVNPLLYVNGSYATTSPLDAVA